MTFAIHLSRLVLAGAFALAIGGTQPLFAQALSNPNPNANSIALARELLVLKGGNQMFDGMVTGVIDRTRDTFIPSNPSLSRPLQEVAAQLRTEFEPKKSEVFNEVSRAYARHFTEAELKELLAFYKTNLGKKVLSSESAAVEDGFKRAQEWTSTFADQVMVRLRAEMKKKGHDL
jgi:uncharacterized protein